MKGAFVNGLASYVRGLFRSSSRMESLTLKEILERARAIFLDTKEEKEPQLPQRDLGRPDQYRAFPKKVSQLISNAGDRTTEPETACSAAMTETVE